MSLYSLDNLQSATPTKKDSVFHDKPSSAVPALCRAFILEVFFWFGFYSFCLSESWKPDRVCIIIQYRASFSGRRIVQTLRALSKSQNWPAGLWSHQTFWQWNRLFPRGFAEKPSLLCIIFRIWQMVWLKMKFSLRWEWAGRSVLTNGKLP